MTLPRYLNKRLKVLKDWSQVTLDLKLNWYLKRWFLWSSIVLWLMLLAAKSFYEQNRKIWNFSDGSFGPESRHTHTHTNTHTNVSKICCGDMRSNDDARNNKAKSRHNIKTAPFLFFPSKFITQILALETN